MIMSLRVAVVAAMASLSAMAQAAPQPACVETTPLQRRPEYESVEIDAQRHILFRLCAPRAQSVKVTSSDMEVIPTGYDGKPAGLVMAKDTQGYWSVRTQMPARSGTYRYTFSIDGMAIADPQATQFAKDARGVRSVLEVPGEEGAFQTWRADVPHGLVSTIDYRSDALGVMRRAHVYTPPGYEAAGNRRYPVLYLVHGSGDSDDSWTSVGHAHLILDNLMAAGKARPMIVVMPFGHTPAREGVERMRNTDFGTDLTQILIPYIDSHFRTRKGPENRAMAGLSMGGAHTIHFGLTHPELFDSIGIFSIGLTQGDQVAAYRAAHDSALTLRAKSRKLVYYAFGKDDFLYAMSAPTRKLLDDYGIPFTYRESAGGHDWMNWRNYLHEFAPMLFR